MEMEPLTKICDTSFNGASKDASLCSGTESGGVADDVTGTKLVVFRCKECDVITESASSLATHNKLKHKATSKGRWGARRKLVEEEELPVRLFRCKLCIAAHALTMPFRSERDFRRHLVQSHQTNDFCKAVISEPVDRCPFCREDVDDGGDRGRHSYGNYRRHLQRRHPDVHRKLCPVCFLSFRSVDQVETHYNHLHADQDWYQERPADFYPSMLTSLSAVRCPHCPATSDSKYDHLMHLISCHNHLKVRLETIRFV